MAMIFQPCFKCKTVLSAGKKIETIIIVINRENKDFAAVRTDQDMVAKKTFLRNAPQGFPSLHRNTVIASNL